MTNGLYNEVHEALQHFCKMRQFAAPEFLRCLMSDGVQQQMPEALDVLRLSLRGGTLAAVATGTDILTISLPDLASGLLENVSATVRDNVKAIFGKAEALGQEDILSGLGTYLEAMPVYTMYDNQAKMAVERLRVRMQEVLSGKLPECPILFKEIEKENIRILKCCTGVLHAEALAKLPFNRCPFCREPLSQVCGIANPIAPPEAAPEAAPEASGISGGASGLPSERAMGKRPGPGSPSMQASKRSKAADDSSDDEEFEFPVPSQRQVPADAQEAFVAKLREISAARMASVDGIMATLKAQCEMNPDSRMLLCFGFERSQARLVTKISDRITREIPRSTVTNVDDCMRDYVRMEDAKNRFDDPVRHPGPKIFILNTTDRRSSVPGLDLYMTDLTIVADQCSLPIKRQAAGRTLRMRPRPETMGPEDRFPAKRLVIATIDNQVPEGLPDR